jgi:hypothetical protein
LLRLLNFPQDQPARKEARPRAQMPFATASHVGSISACISGATMLEPCDLIGSMSSLAIGAVE